VAEACKRRFNAYTGMCRAQHGGIPMEKCAPMDDLPDRLSNDPASPYHNAELLERGIGIRFRGVEKHNVEEYCVSEGWIRVAAGNARDRRGNPLIIKLTGKVEPYFRDP
jgi:hypothetical protein